jgi:hypothetical protein
MAAAVAQRGLTIITFDTPECNPASIDEAQTAKASERTSEDLIHLLVTTPKSSILRAKSETLPKQRKDFYGTIINHSKNKKKRKQKIKFREDGDEINEVENWKEYNVNNRECECNLF